MIYLDNAATTLMYPEVRDTVSYYENIFIIRHLLIPQVKNKKRT